MKSLFFVFIVLAMTIFAQQLDTLDRVDLKNNKTYTGKVVKVTSNTVQLKESLTNILYEFNKSEIKDLRLSNGVTLTFENTAPQPGQQQNVTGSARPETQTQNPQTQNPTSQNQPVQNPPVQNPPVQNPSAQNPAVGSGRTQAGEQTQTGSQQTENKQPTENRGQNAAAPADEGTSGLNTSQMIMLAAGGLVVLLLIGALIF
ncbi:MAG TPA: hypothetical protein VHO03_18435 [Ignavibacteriales bacterium]|nr:hypothetical protein [Ignavibacteriales bacterium]